MRVHDPADGGLLDDGGPAAPHHIDDTHGNQSTNQPVNKKFNQSFNYEPIISQPSNEPIISHKN